MTNQEAIIQLDYLKDFKTPDQVKALDMAIKALEQEPTIGQLFSCEEIEELREKIWKQVEQEPKTGHWIAHPKGVYAHLVCDKCLSNAPYDCKTNYCPNCGARMESEDK